jgi:hypothetical protein
VKRVFSLLVVALLVFAAAPQAVNLNGRGQVAMGVGDGVASIDGKVIGAGGGTDWVGDDEVVFQTDRHSIAIYNQRTGELREVAPSGANVLRAGGGCWASWLAGVGLYSSTDFRRPTAALADVSPDCAIGYVPDQQTGLGVTVHERDGSEWALSAGVVSDLQLLGQRRAIWREGLSARVANLPIPTTLARVWRPRASFCAGEWWLAYWTEPQPRGLVLHPFGSTRGYLLTSSDAFAHDFVCSGNLATVAWSRREGERPEDLAGAAFDVTTHARVELAAAPDPPKTEDCGDRVDNDGDGLVDEGCPTEPDQPQPIPCGHIPEAGQKALQKLWTVPQINALTRGDDDQRREAAGYYAEQLEFTLRQGWGRKRADPGRPLSKDAMAIQKQGHLCGWDIVDGVKRTLAFNEGEDITGQVFVPLTTPGTGPSGGPKDWVAHFFGGGTPTDPDPGNGAQIVALKRRIADLEAENASLAEAHGRDSARIDQLEQLQRALETERDQLKAKVDELEARPTEYSCEAKVPALLKMLGVKVGCRVFPTPAPVQ